MRNTNIFTSVIFVSICLFHIGILYLLNMSPLLKISPSQVGTFEVVNIEAAVALTQAESQSAQPQQTPMAKSTPKVSAPPKLPVPKTVPDKVPQPQYAVAEHAAAPVHANKTPEPSNSQAVGEAVVAITAENQSSQNNKSQNSATTASNQGEGSSRQGVTLDEAVSQGSISAGQINNIARKYPETAREQGIEGSVRLRVVVGPNGRAQEVTVLSSPHQLLSNAARLGARSATYKPAMTNGKAITTQLEFNVVYQIKK